MQYFSQYNQDQFLDRNVFKGKKGGFFIELGADDGVTHSNTLFFEREHGWKGICIEPRKEPYELLKKNRRCYCENVCVSDKPENASFLSIDGFGGQLSGLVDKLEKKHLDRINSTSLNTNTFKIDCVTLGYLMHKYHTESVDYLSLDTEGGELDILKSLDFKNHNIKVISVETTTVNKKIGQFMRKVGYRLATKIKIDEIYILRGCEYDEYHDPSIKKMKRLYNDLKRYVSL
ncbi:MAG: FkbM family methyltransferase, partial [Patescibacteria group bacterium]|nr:FkbM family methyltransferase [Patescibacteria group bacterium]